MPGIHRKNCLTTHWSCAFRLCAVYVNISVTAVSSNAFPIINYFNDIIVPDQDKTLLEENLPTDSEINALLELAADADDDTAFLVFSLAVKCGLTSSEISKLDVEHIVIDVQERFCIQFPPSRKTSRIIRLPKDINDLLQTYIEKYNRIEGAVFYNKHQTRLKVRDAQRILNHYIELGMECQKIHKHFTFQDLRHSAFKYMLAGGASEDEAPHTGHHNKMAVPLPAYCPRHGCIGQC